MELVCRRRQPVAAAHHRLPAGRTDPRPDHSVIGGNYRNFLTRVANDTVTAGGNVVVVGYPHLIEDPQRWVGVAQTLDLCNGVQRGDANQIRGWAGLLNAEIGSAVADVNAAKPNGVSFTFVNIADGAGADTSDPDLYEPAGSAARHNLCGTQPWLNGLERTKGFHPTLEGHAHTGALVARVLNGLDWSRL